MFQRLRHAIISLKLARYLVYSRLITRIWLLSEFEIWHFHVLCVVSIFKLLISCKRNPSSTTKVQTYYPMEETRAWSSQTLPANLSFHIFHFVRTNYNFQSNSTERLISFEIKAKESFAGIKFEHVIRSPEETERERERERERIKFLFVPTISQRTQPLWLCTVRDRTRIPLNESGRVDWFRLSKLSVRRPGDRLAITAAKPSTGTSLLKIR